MFEAVDSPYLVSFDGKFRVSNASTTLPKKAPDKDARKTQLGMCAADGI